MTMTNQFCECPYDGWCERYQRTMTGRYREICQGINCDLGSAALHRWDWEQEKRPIVHLSPPNPIPLIIRQNQAPGDAVVLTAAIYSLHKSHPGKYLTSVDTPHPEVFQYNPDVVSANALTDPLILEMHYPAIHQSNQRGIHFMQGMCEFMGSALGIHIPLMTNRPHIYFNYQEPKVDEYWVVCSGGKRDFTNKLWGFQNYAKVLHQLPNIRFVQVGEKREEHQRLHGAFDLVGLTNLRQLFDVVRASRGVVCGVSLLMHVAAALEKPCIVIAGGREPVQWNAYPRQQYLHTVGSMGCSSPQGEQGACWRSRLYPLGDSEVLDKNTCLYPVGDAPECMRKISPERVAELVLMYNQQYERE